MNFQDHYFFFAETWEDLNFEIGRSKVLFLIRLIHFTHTPYDFTTPDIKITVEISINLYISV